MRLSLSEIAHCLDLCAPDVEICGVAIDSRKIKPGDLFVCLPGERVDGHDYAPKALEAGAAAILAQRPLSSCSAPVLIVPDTEKALGKIAAWWRKKTKAKVICITGTAGKTTLKETLAAILTLAGKTAYTKGNENNQLGLPLTILSADGDEAYWLLEAGISHAGDMEYLGKIAQPDLAIILNVGAGHTAGLGDHGVAWHKTRLLTCLAPQGTALINADYPDLLTETTRLGIDFKCFRSKPGWCTFGLIEQDQGVFNIDMNGSKESFATPFNGAYGSELALAAVGAATLLGIGADTIQAGFSSTVLPGQRYQRSQAGAYTIIDDTYNANPLSMRRMLEAAAQEARNADLPLIAVLGEMGELGDLAPVEHIQLGKFLALIKPAAVFWKGAWFNEIAKAMTGADADMETYRQMGIMPLSTPEEFTNTWAALPEKALVFFKGSRANKLEDFLEAFRKKQEIKDVL